MTEDQCFWTVMVVLGACLLFTIFRKQKDYVTPTLSEITRERSKSYIDFGLIPPICFEELDSMLMYDKSPDTRAVVHRGCELNRAVCSLHVIVSQVEPNLIYMGHVVTHESQIKFDSGKGSTCMLYYKPFGVIKIPLLRVDVVFPKSSLETMGFYFSGPLGRQIAELFYEDMEDITQDFEQEELVI